MPNLSFYDRLLEIPDKSNNLQWLRFVRLKVVPNAYADGIEDFVARPLDFSAHKWPETFFYIFSNYEVLNLDKNSNPVRINSEVVEMGAFEVEVKVRNWQDLFLLGEERSEIVCQALIDSCAIQLSLPVELIEKLKSKSKYRV